MAFYREASDSHLWKLMRSPEKDWERTKEESEDRRKRVNKGCLGKCRATRQKSVKEARIWARILLEAGDRTVATLLTSMPSGGD